MHPLRTARRARGLTLIELAAMSGVPARELGAAEHGMAPLQPGAAARLAPYLGVSPALLAATPLLPQVGAPPRWNLAAAAAFVASTLAVSSSIAGAGALIPAPAVDLPLPPLPAAQAQPPQQLAAPAAESTATPAPPSATPAPTSTPPAPAPAAAAPQRAADGPPTLCPLLAAPGRVVITQGYGEGTHAPGDTAGALDLAIDADGDGVPEISSTAGIVVLATHSGTARVYLDSWPGGNVVRILEDGGGWSTLYAHLDMVAVVDGAKVAAGSPIGTVGMTGMASGPHLHYEIRRGESNIDPEGVAPCWHR